MARAKIQTIGCFIRGNASFVEEKKKGWRGEKGDEDRASVLAEETNCRTVVAVERTHVRLQVRLHLENRITVRFTESRPRPLKLQCTCTHTHIHRWLLNVVRPLCFRWFSARAWSPTSRRSPKSSKPTLLLAVPSLWAFCLVAREDWMVKWEGKLAKNAESLRYLKEKGRKCSRIGIDSLFLMIFCISSLELETRLSESSVE